VKRLACDASLVIVTEDERGTPLNVGRKQRVVSTPLRRAVLARDRHCTFPGCHRTRFVEAHHVHHWVEGGETSVDNLLLLCSYHHRLLPEGG
jgi:predicted restriction endonuclease